MKNKNVEFNILFLLNENVEFNIVFCRMKMLNSTFCLVL